MRLLLLSEKKVKLYQSDLQDTVTSRGRHMDTNSIRCLVVFVSST